MSNVEADRVSTPPKEIGRSPCAGEEESSNKAGNDGNLRFVMSELVPSSLQKATQLVLKSLNPQVELLNQRDGDQSACWTRFSSWLKAALILEVFDRYERKADMMLERKVNQLLGSLEAEASAAPFPRSNRTANAPTTKDQCDEAFSAPSPFLAADEVQLVDSMLRSQEELKLLRGVEQQLRAYLETLRAECESLACQRSQLPHTPPSPRARAP